LNLFQVLHVVPCTDRELGRGIGLVRLKVEEHAQLLNALFFHELDVYEMGLGTVRLPEGVGVVIA
jgi:hypothetical protein